MVVMSSDKWLGDFSRKTRYVCVLEEIAALDFSKRGYPVRYGGEGRGDDGQWLGSAASQAAVRWGVSEAALCGKGQGCSRFPLSSRLVGGRELGKRRARAAGTDATYPSYMPAGGFLGKDQNNPPPGFGP